MFGDLFRAAGSIARSVVGLPFSVVAEALDVSEDAVRQAVRAGCTTKDEIRAWIRDNL